MTQFATDRLRNVALIGHSSAGKTSLVEAMLLRSGATTRLGKVENGTATTDFEPEEHKRHISINLGLAPVHWRDTKINLIDTPGYADFVGETCAALAVSDAALLVLCAASGVEVGSEQTWKIAEEAGLPRIIVVNKIDRDTADFGRAVDDARRLFGKRCIAAHMPIGKDGDVHGIIDLIHMKALIAADAADEEIPEELKAEAEERRGQLVEAVAETDDELLIRYLDGETLTSDEISAALRNATREGAVYPVLAATATETKGIGLLLDALVDLAPAPGDRSPMTASANGKDEAIEADAAGAAVGRVFKSTADAHIGKLTYLKVLRGTIKSDSHIWNTTGDHDERLGQLFMMTGKNQEPVAEVAAGDIAAVAKLAGTHTGDTLAEKGHPVRLPELTFPSPVFASSIAPKAKADLDKLSTAISRLTDEDPSLHVEKDPATGETIMSGLGESHIDVAAEKMHRKFGVDVILNVPKIPYRETITATVKSEYKHKKQTGGHGQYGHVFLELQPRPRGAGFEFDQKVVGGSVPRNYIPAVEKGVNEALTDGALGHFPVVDVKAILYDGSHHAVDSSEMAFKLAAAQAFRKGVAVANPVILEPIGRISVRVPDDNLGDAMGDLNTRRAHVTGTVPDGDYTIIEAEVPLAEVMRYSTVLRSITHGRGTHTISFERYAQVPAHAAQEIIATVGGGRS